MLVTPIVVACSVGFLTAIYNYVERKRKHDSFLDAIVIVNGRDEYTLHCRRNDEDLYNWAISFCSTKGKMALSYQSYSVLITIFCLWLCVGTQYGFELNTIHDCTNPLVSALRATMGSPSCEEAMKIVHVSLGSSAIEESEHESTVAAETNTAEAAAQQTHTAEESILAEKTQIKEEAIDSPPPVFTPPLLKLPLEINGVTYIFEYVASADRRERNAVAAKLAASFCDIHGGELVETHPIITGLTQSGVESAAEFEERRRRTAKELLQSQCLEPIQGALAANMEYPTAY